MEGLTTKELTELTGVPRTALTYWKDEGLFHPLPESAVEKTRKRRYDLQNTQIALTISKLWEQGVSLQKIREAAKRLKDYDEDLTSAALYTDGAGVYQVKNKEKLLTDLTENPGQLTFMTIFSLEEVAEKAKEAFEERKEVA